MYTLTCDIGHFDLLYQNYKLLTKPIGQIDHYESLTMSFEITYVQLTNNDASMWAWNESMWASSMYISRYTTIIEGDYNINTYNIDIYNIIVI